MALNPSPNMAQAAWIPWSSRWALGHKGVVTMVLAHGRQP
jgi:hypothetical protein